MSDWPKITLVTPSMNQGQYIEATLQSVLMQGYPNLEYIVVDGGSKDDSVEVIRRYADRLTWWISEPDSGQTDALIKGFARCSGELLNWLNADDLLRPGALFAVARAYRESHAGLLVGRDWHFTEDPDRPAFVFEPAGYVYPDCLRFWDGNFRYHQPCTFFTHDAYLRAGGLDRHLHYAMDYDFYCRLLSLPDVRAHLIDAELSAFRLHEGAKTSRAKASFIKELRHISRRHWPAHWSIGEAKRMDRYCAECSVFQAAEAFRSHDWRKSAEAVFLSCRYAPFHSASFLLQRLGKHLGFQHV